MNNTELPHEFAIEDILTVSTGRFFGKANTEGVRRLISRLVGRPVGLAEAGALRESVRPGLLKQFPWLTEIKAESFTHHNEHQKLLALRKQRGDRLLVMPLESTALLMPRQRPSPSDREIIGAARPQFR